MDRRLLFHRRVTLAPPALLSDVPHVSTVIAARTLVALLFFGALSSFVGAVIGVAANGAGVPLSYLDHTPFTSFVLPGLILGVVVGGTQLGGAIALLAKHRQGPLLATVAGFGMLIWIFAELAILRQYSWLQTGYFALGGVELILVLALLGVVPAVVAPSRAEGRG